MSSPVYTPKLPRWWWLHHAGYRRYMVRELSCIPIGVFAVMLIVGGWRLGQGAESWQAFRAALATPLAVAWQLIALAFAVYHSITWFALAPRTMPLRIGARRLPASWIAGAHYLAWAVLSLLVLRIVGG
jgi:fumarate reductase subunit C